MTSKSEKVVLKAAMRWYRMWMPLNPKKQLGELGDKAAQLYDACAHYVQATKGKRK